MTSHTALPLILKRLHNTPFFTTLQTTCTSLLKVGQSCLQTAGAIHPVGWCHTPCRLVPFTLCGHRLTR